MLRSTKKTTYNKRFCASPVRHLNPGFIYLSTKCKAKRYDGLHKAANVTRHCPSHSLLLCFSCNSRTFCFALPGFLALATRRVMARIWRSSFEPVKPSKRVSGLSMMKGLVWLLIDDQDTDHCTAPGWVSASSRTRI